ncbi:hypothetical protein R1sor_022948 [Riccia sorocarpa]|uniref:Uncharacterized protein n=1 Tax=Riccia sorocarpa TaxID=122646 RepID=A0ABD3GND1_9MARC
MGMRAHLRFTLLPPSFPSSLPTRLLGLLLPFIRHTDILSFFFYPWFVLVGLGLYPPSSTPPPLARQSRRERGRERGRGRGALPPTLPHRDTRNGGRDPLPRHSDSRSSDPPPRHSDLGPSDPPPRSSDPGPFDPPPRRSGPRASDLPSRPSDPGPSDPPPRRSGPRASDLPPRPSDPGPSNPPPRRSSARSSDLPPRPSDPGPYDPSSRPSDSRSSDPPPRRFDTDSVPERLWIPRRPRQSHRAPSSSEIPSDMLATVQEGIRLLFDGVESERRDFSADELERLIAGAIERRRRRSRSRSPRRDRRDGRDGRDRQPRLPVELGTAGFTNDPYRGTLTSIIRQLCMLHHPDLHFTISHLTTEEQYRLFTDIRSRFTRSEELSKKELKDTVCHHFRDRKYGRLRKLKAMLSELDYDTDPDASLEKPAWISETSWAVMLSDAQQCFWQSEMNRMEKALVHTREDEAAGRETFVQCLIWRRGE